MSQGPFKGEGETVEVVDDRVGEGRSQEGERSGLKFNDPEWLYHQYHILKKSIEEIADGVGFSPTVIRNRMVQFGIERRTTAEAQSVAQRKHAPFRDEDWLREQYWDKELTLSEVASLADTSQGVIRKWMGRFGIETRDTADYEKDLSEYDDADWLHRQYWELGKSMHKIQLGLEGVNSKDIRHLLEKNDIEIRPDGVPAPKSKPNKQGGESNRVFESDGKPALDMSEQSIAERPEAPTLADKDDWVKHRDKSWLYEKYWREELSVSEVAEACGRAKTTIIEWMDRHGIPRRKFRSDLENWMGAFMEQTEPDRTVECGLCSGTGIHMDDTCRRCDGKGEYET